jgi:hypothetical protein
LLRKICRHINHRLATSWPLREEKGKGFSSLFIFIKPPIISMAGRTLGRAISVRGNPHLHPQDVVRDLRVFSFGIENTIPIIFSRFPENCVVLTKITPCKKRQVSSLNISQNVFSNSLRTNLC